MPNRTSPLRVPFQRLASSSNSASASSRTQGMVRVAWCPAPQLLGIDLADSELRLRLDRRCDQIGRRGGHRMVERAGGPGGEHFHAGDIARHPHRRLVHPGREWKQEVADPVFQEKSVGQSLEQSVPVVLVHVDQAGHHDRAGRIDHLIESFGAGRFGGGANRGNRVAIHGDKPVGKDVAPSIDGDDVAIVDQKSNSSRWPSQFAMERQEAWHRKAD